MRSNSEYTEISCCLKMLTPYFTTKKNGTGLGLAIVNKIVNDHNGELKLYQSKSGAKVQIVIPRKIWRMKF